MEREEDDTLIDGLMDRQIYRYTEIDQKRQTRTGRQRQADRDRQADRHTDKACNGHK